MLNQFSNNPYKSLVLLITQRVRFVLLVNTCCEEETEKFANFLARKLLILQFSLIFLSKNVSFSINFFAVVLFKIVV